MMQHVAMLTPKIKTNATSATNAIFVLGYTATVSLNIVSITSMSVTFKTVILILLMLTMI